MERGAWWATVHRVIKSWTRLKRFSTQAFKIQESSENARYCYYYVTCYKTSTLLGTGNSQKKKKKWQKKTKDASYQRYVQVSGESAFSYLV